MNQQPYFEKPVEEQYVRIRTEEGSIEPIELGQIYDKENDAVTQVFKCLICRDDDPTFMLYDEKHNVISFTKHAAIGTYQIQLTLTDDNQVDPK